MLGRYEAFRARSDILVLLRQGALYGALRRSDKAFTPQPRRLYYLTVLKRIERTQNMAKRLEMSGTNIPYDAFLSYNWRDHSAVETLARRLREQGLNAFLDRWYLVPGIDWQQELERHLSRDAAFPVIPVLLPGADPTPGFLGLNTWVDMRAGLDTPRQLMMLVKAVQGEALGPVPVVYGPTSRPPRVKTGPHRPYERVRLLSGKGCLVGCSMHTARK